MEGNGSGNETSQLASSPVGNTHNQDSVIASYKELIKEQVNMNFKLSSSDFNPLGFVLNSY